MDSSAEEILLEMQATAAEIARLEGRLARQVVSFARASKSRHGVVDEVAMALCMTKFKAQALLGRAEGLVERMPGVLGLVETGRVPMASAAAVHDASAWLADDKAAGVDEVMAGRLVGKNPTQARRSATAAVARADPEGFEERSRRQRAARGFRLQRGASGMAGLFLENAPVAKAMAAYVCVDRQARRLHTAEEPRTLEQLRADVALERLLATPIDDEATAPDYAVAGAGVGAEPAATAVAGGGRFRRRWGVPSRLGRRHWPAHHR